MRIGDPVELMDILQSVIEYYGGIHATPDNVLSLKHEAFLRLPLSGENINAARERIKIRIEERQKIKG